uniref:Venom redulysin protein 6 n=1 Tax=Pristhesancus plagipennis TaxID=1955184 RepID=A0A1Q1NPF3_PRIPG|nr:venom redulysin protein 6 [Pristhesancus plagipennis]
MSKIWLLLLLVGVFQLVQSFPALEEDEYELDRSDEERSFSEWAKHQWDGAKNQYKKVKKAIVATIKKGKQYLKEKGVQMDPLVCEGGNQCKTCLSFLKMKKKFCMEVKFFSKGELRFANVKLIRERDDKEPKELFKPLDIPMGKESNCIKLGSWFGKCCIQGVEGTIKANNINFCVAAVLKEYGVGAKICLNHENGKLKVRLRPKMFAGDDDDGAVLEAGEKDDEAKMVDAEE